MTRLIEPTQLSRMPRMNAPVVPSSWQSRIVADLQEIGVLLVEDGNHGEYRPLPHEFTDQGVAFIRAADMDAHGVVRFDTASRINAEARQRIRKGIGAPGDVLLSHKGTVGKVAFAPANAPEFVCSPQTTFWRVLDERVLDRRYLFCFLRSSYFHEQLASRKGETDMADYVSLTVQRTFSVVLPPIGEQQAIAEVLGALDDKIELNRRTSATISEFSRSAFGVFFEEPVSASHWPTRTVGECVMVLGGSTPSTSDSSFWDDGRFCWATPKDLSQLSAPVLLDTERRITDAGLARISSGLLPAGTLLLSSRAPIGYLAIAEVPVAVNQGFIAIRCTDALPNLFMLRWLERSHEEILARANGSTFLEINKANFRAMPIVVPPRDRMDAFMSVVSPMHERLVFLERESRVLSALRDDLLPRLVSGQLRIPDAEHALAEAGV